MSYEEMSRARRSLRSSRTAASDTDMRTVLENGIRDISGEVRNSLDFHRSQEGGGEVSHVVLSGAVRRTSPASPRRCRLARRRGSLRGARAARRRARRERVLAPPGRRDRSCRGGGSAMRAVNLIPADQRSGASVGAGRSQGGAYAVLALAVGVALLAVLYGKAHHQVTSRRARSRRDHRTGPQRPGRRRTARSLHELHRPAPAARTGRQHARRLPLRLGARLPRIRPRAAAADLDPVADRHDRLGQRLRAARPPAARPPAARPPPAVLLQRSAASTPVASATPPGSVPTFTISGCATSQPAVAQTLQRLRLMDGVSEVALAELHGGRRLVRQRLGQHRVRRMSAQRPRVHRADHL